MNVEDFVATEWIFFIIQIFNKNNSSLLSGLDVQSDCDAPTHVHVWTIMEGGFFIILLLWRRVLKTTWPTSRLAKKEAITFWGWSDVDLVWTTRPTEWRGLCRAHLVNEFTHSRGRWTSLWPWSNLSYVRCLIAPSVANVCCNNNQEIHRQSERLKLPLSSPAFEHVERSFLAPPARTN